MSLASELIISKILPENDREKAEAIILNLPITAKEKKYIYIDYCRIYGIPLTAEGVKKATGKGNI